MQAKPCSRLPNPGRAFRHEDVDPDKAVAKASEPVIAGAR
jgi:hypothetical protein